MSKWVKSGGVLIYFDLLDKYLFGRSLKFFCWNVAKEELVSA